MKLNIFLILLICLINIAYASYVKGAGRNYPNADQEGKFLFSFFFVVINLDILVFA